MIEGKSKALKEFFTEKYWIFIAILVVLLVIGIPFLGFGKKETGKTISCGDGSSHNTCSSRMPYFCEEGQLVEKASVCDCPELLSIEGDSCVSKYQTNPKDITLDYILRGEKKKMNLVVYEGMINYISNLSVFIRYNVSEQPSRQDFKLRNINEPEQKLLLSSFITDIQNLEKDKVEQMRTAVSLVQNIPYRFPDKTISIGEAEANYSRYPYEVLYEQEGICAEKSELLAFLLKELGYEVVLFYHPDEDHESIGIKCPVEHSLGGSGYCFVETTGPSIITDDKITYVGGMTLESEPKIIPLFKGDSLPKDMYEYTDADELVSLRKEIEEKTWVWPFKKEKLRELSRKYGLVEEYNLE